MADTVLDGMLSMETGAKTILLPPNSQIETPEMKHFTWQDYMMFLVMLIICVCIGLYFGVYKATTNAQEYLLGGRKMGTLPITLSLIASYISGITMLGVPTEIYLYGTQYLYIVVGLFTMTILMNFVYLPVFYGLKTTSSYEYLERRFDKNVRFFAAILFTVAMITWLPIVIYVPALAFNHVTDLNIHVASAVLCIVCIFYTSLGGLKAVVWTDVVQSLIMFAAMVLVAVKGTLDIGGLKTVIERNVESGRLEKPDFSDFTMQTRYNFWSLAIGGTFLLLQIAAVNQNMLQRYMSLPSIRSAKLTVWLFALGITAILLLTGYCGLLSYATFHKCDPISTKLAKEKDQLLPLLMMQVLAEFPGLPGIFVAGLLSASLSSLSTGLNAMALVTIEDFYKFFFSKPLNEKRASLIMKMTVVIFGCICVALVYVIQNLGGAVLQTSLSLGTIASGASLSLFTMGILIPWVNHKGALVGGITSLIFMLWLGIKGQIAFSSGDLFFPTKPLTTEGCHYHLLNNQQSNLDIHINITGADNNDFQDKFRFHHISYLWYTSLGMFISVVVAILVSFATKPNNPKDIDPSLLSPCIRRFIKPRDFPNEPSEGIIFAFASNDIKQELNMEKTKSQKLHEPDD